MRPFRAALFASTFASLAGAARADVTVTIDRMTGERASAAYKFATVPPPAADDLASGAAITFEGRRDPNGGEAAILVDGKGATSSDDPENNFFFAPLTIGGRLKIDLGGVKDVGQINTYSWHPDTRGPQVYKVYIAEGTEDNFDTDPKLFVDLEMTGWTRIATVDTRTQAGGRAQHGVSIADSDRASLGKARYVLFDVERTETDDANGNTFYSEIDVVALDKLAPAKAQTGPAGGYEVVIDTAGLDPEMLAWAEQKLKPACQAWYPKIVEMLPSDGFESPRTFTVTFKTDMRGTPAAASGNRVMCNLGWFEENKEGEAIGAVVHEMVHVVQQYHFGRKNAPFWLQEGIPDYIRWFLYEPEKNGAQIRNPARVKYDNAYRVSGNFLNWATNTYDKELVKKVNAAIRQGKYTDEIWKDLTGGKTLDDLNAEWKESLSKK